MKKRVLIIAENHLNKSGVPAVILSIVKLMKDDYIFDIVVFNNDGFYNQEFLSYGGKIILFDLKKYNSKVKKYLYYLFMYQKEMKRQLKNKIDIESYNIIHCFREDLSFPFLKYAKQHSIFKRITHSNSFASKNKNIFYRLLLKINRYKTIKYSTNLIGVSKECCQDFYGKHFFTVIPNTYNEKIYYPHMHKKDTQFNIIQIGTFSNRKNQLFSINVLNEILKKNNKVHLYFLGKEAENGYLNKMNNLIDKFKINDKVTFCLPDSNQLKILEKADITIMPSLQEAFGLTIIESQAFSVPCIASNFISEELNCGQLYRFELNTTTWVTILNKIINKEFVLNKISDMKKFSNTTFKNNIAKIYK